MRQMRFQCGFFVFIVAVVSCCASSARAQSGVTAEPIYCPSTGRTIPAGTPGDELDSLCPPGSGGSGASSPSGPSAAEIEAERAREAEKKRLENAQRQMEQERLAREAEQKRAQEEFLMEVRKAAGDLKGVSHDDMGLKGVDGNAAFFSLKGVSPEEAGAAIETAPPDASSRDVSTATKQLTCAADITNYALKHVSNIVSGTGSQTDMDEIKYLAGEAVNALQGDPIGVQCKSSGLLKFTKAPDVKAITPAYKAALNKMVRDSQKLYATDQQAAAARQKFDDAKKRTGDLKNQRATQGSQRPDASQASPKPTGDAAADEAYAEQKAWREKDQQQINQVYEVQKKLQQQQFDALALLRKAQAELNAISSEKISETKAATQDVKQISALESGNAPQ